MKKINARDIISVMDQQRVHDFSNCEIEGALILNLNHTLSMTFTGSKFIGIVQIDCRTSDSINLNFDNAEFFTTLTIKLQRGTISFINANFNSGVGVNL